MAKVRIGVIGCGAMGRGIHLPSLASLPDCEVGAVCDLVREKADAMAAKYNIPRAYYLHTDLIAGEAGRLDGVVCLVEPDRMYRVVYDCLKGGFNVMMEKPAGINSYQSDSLARTAKAMNLKLAVAMNRRHIPLVREVMRIMNELTEINEVNGVFIKHSDIAASWHYMDAYVSDIIHAVDLVRWLSGGAKLAKAATVSRAINSPVTNSWLSVFAMDNGVAGTLRANYQTASRVHTFEVHGSSASAYISLGCRAATDDHSYRVGQHIFPCGVRIYSPGKTKLDGVPLQEDGVLRILRLQVGERDFVAALRDCREPLWPKTQPSPCIWQRSCSQKKY